MCTCWDTCGSQRRMSGVGSLGIELRSLGLAASTFFSTELSHWPTHAYPELALWRAGAIGQWYGTCTVCPRSGIQPPVLQENNRWNRVGIGDSLWRYGLTCSQKDFVPAFVRQPKDTWRVPYRSRNIRVNSGTRDMIALYLNACLVCFLKPRVLSPALHNPSIWFSALGGMEAWRWEG